MEVARQATFRPLLTFRFRPYGTGDLTGKYRSPGSRYLTCSPRLNVWGRATTEMQCDWWWLIVVMSDYCVKGVSLPRSSTAISDIGIDM
ncbi:hypothetical protein AVEN_168125-1 [Araneus ventricosus]|uniref:Uncharacterized protein n=1 Tax=Araneus ventricosus TaxID=182803 RepID=A0A4Y2V7C0_ARAVE|nr:hypothetical protein AVEN_168125-1 [Araneus ventricosus]